jgi:acetyltransferase-like isoleucine patch superfamily enzyme
MMNSTIPKEYKNEYMKEIIIKKQSIVGAGSIIMPGVVLEEGTTVGAMSLVLKSTQSWGIYVGIPAKRLKNRKKDLLELEKQYLENEGKQ